MLRHIFPLVSLLFCATIFSSPLMAELAPAHGKIILTVTGKIKHTNHLNRAEFDQQLLESLEQHEVATSNPWFADQNTYRGPLGRAIIKAVGAEDATIMRISSINSFLADIPVSDFMDYDVILALQKNGQLQSIRDRGPLFVIYPFDQRANLRTQMHYNRSVWQVKAIDFR